MVNTNRLNRHDVTLSITLFIVGSGYFEIEDVLYK